MTAAILSLGAGGFAHATGRSGDTPGPSFSLFSSNTADKAALAESLSVALDAGAIGQIRFKDPDAMRDFYTQRAGQPLWVDSRGGNAGAVAAMQGIFQNAWAHGLKADSYHVKDMQPLLQARTPAEKAQLELLLSDAAIRYARDLTGFHLPAAAIKQNPSFWRKPMTATAVLSALGEGADPVAVLRSIAPKDPLYLRLQTELAALSANAAPPYEAYLPIGFSGRLLRPQDFDKGVLKLRARLGLQHDPSYGAEEKYDDALAAAVMTFQHENGLNADGVIGPQTLVALNRTVRARMEQIVVNMERLRWLNQDRPEKYLLVNIPSATLWAVDAGEAVFEMPVIVGRSERQTPSFITEISGIRFNPKWTVPPTIKAEDFLPKLVEDPTYLVNKGIEVYQIVDGQRETLDSTAIDWSTVQRSDLKYLRMVQGAGDNNALGRIRVLMPNPYDIYLHDTNAPEYFKKPSRAASSGCIRLFEPEKVARFILGPNKNWSDERMNSIIATTRTTEITAEQKIPVFILYQTIWLDAEGRLVYGPDIYKQDKRILDVMDSQNILHIPSPDDVLLASTGTDKTIH